MITYATSKDIVDLVAKSEVLVLVQGDNPDSDSLATSLALEQILGDLGKRISLYCGVDIPTYLRYLPGWDRVEKQLPQKFDASIIVDTSSDSILEQLDKTNQKMWLKNKPSVIIDHHASESTIQFATIVCNPSEAVASSEVVYELSKQLEWPVNKVAKDMLAIAILADSQGLMSEGTSARSIHIIGELVEAGVQLASIDAARKETMRREPELVHYKGRLLQRVEYFNENKIALLHIPWDEIETYSHLYNPSMLVIDDMRMTRDTDVAICFKTYPSNRITAKIRCNYGKGVANQIAEHFGGGGHPYAAGFKIQDGRSYEEIKQECLTKTTELLQTLNEDHSHATE